MNNFQKVDQFTIAMKQPRKVDLTPKEEDLIRLRTKLIYEEVDEFMEEIYEIDFFEAHLLRKKIDKENVLKELCDILYVVYGFASTFGLDIDTAFNRVHASNMSKLDDDGNPVYRDDGKVMKGPHYKPADLKDLVA